MQPAATHTQDDESKQAVLWQQPLEKFTQRMEAMETKLEAMAMENSRNSQSNPLPKKSLERKRGR